jgi:hypothetical protein
LVARSYRPYRSDWDHDHCAFCWANFSDREGDLHRGYSTEDAYHWICAPCFVDFRDEFGWRVVRGDSDGTGST